jgi:hypothetical protein
MLTVLLGALTATIRAGLTSYRAAASAPDDEVSHPAVIHLSRAEIGRSVYRARQLERDLKRDPGDFDVLLRLGQLHLQLAECEVDHKASHLRLSRHYLYQANARTQFRWEQNWIRGLMEVANSPNPMTNVSNLPGDYGPPWRANEGWIRMRLAFQEEQVNAHPYDARLLRRVASSYVALYAVMSTGSASRVFHSDADEVMVSDPREVRLLAEQYIRRALRCSRTHEARCRALYAEAQLCRVLRQPERASAILDEFLALQPNNWLVSMEAAALARELSRSEKAERYQALSAQWRLPGWI